MQLIDPFLFIVIALLIGVIIWLLYQARTEREVLMSTHTQDRNKLINALIARKPEELRDLTLADKVAPIKPQEQTPPDLVPLDQVSEEDFDKHIAEQLANG